MVVGQFDYKFEELPLLHLGERIVAGLIDGWALIQFEDPSGEWTIQRIWVEGAYIPKIGEKGRVEKVELTDDMFDHVSAVIEEQHASFIEETMRRHIENAEGAL